MALHMNLLKYVSFRENLQLLLVACTVAEDHSGQVNAARDVFQY